MRSGTRRPPAPIRMSALVGAVDREWRSRFAAAAAGDLAELDTVPALVTVPNVELLEVGEDWETSTGTFTWSVRDLQSAVAAQYDQAIRTPVIKLGHVDSRFDGQPSLGRIENLHLTNNDQTLVGDLVGVPYWLAECMASAFPRRSIEGFFDYTTRTGNTWAFALTAVALLGDAYPAINTLEDVQALFGKEPPVFVPVADNEQVVADAYGEMTVAIPAGDPHLVLASATSFGDLPLSDRDRAWDAGAAKGRIRNWASSDGSGDTDKIDWAKFGKAFFWRAAAGSDQIGDYKLPFADVVDGTLTAVWRGVTAAAQRLGAADIPDEDVSGVQNHIAKYYNKAKAKYNDASIEVPWAAAGTPRRVAAADITNSTKCQRDGCGHMASMHNDTADGNNTGACTAQNCDCSEMMVAATAAGAPRFAAADVSVNDVVTAFYDEGPGGEPGNYWWWIREVRVEPAEVIVDDDEGHLYRVPYAIGSGDGTGAVTFGEPQEVRIQYVNVAAAGQQRLANFANPVAAGRPRTGRVANATDDHTTTQGGPEVQLTDAELRALGLEPGATDDAIHEALAARLTANAETTTPPAGGDGGTGGDAGTTTPPGETTQQPTQPAPASAPAPAPDGGNTGTGGGTTEGGDGNTTAQVPEGMVLVDASLLDEVRQGAAIARQMQEQAVAAARARVVDDAIREGKVAASRRDHWIERMTVDEEGTKAWLATAESIIPVRERGYAGDATGDDGPAGGVAATQYPESWKPIANQARRAAASRVKVGRD